MMVVEKTVPFRSYQTVTLPNGGAPVDVQPAANSPHGYREPYVTLYCIDPGSVGETVFGLFMIRSGNEFPKDLRIFPEHHKLLNQTLEPNARYVATVSGWHMFLGNPRTEEKNND